MAEDMPVNRNGRNMNGRNRQITYNMGGREVLGFMTGRKRVRGSELFGFLAVVCLLAILMAGPAQALTLNLTLNDYPDIVSSGITTGYDADAGVFSASGCALTLDYDGVSDVEYITGSGTFDLTATIDDSGGLISGTLTITGTVANLGFSGPDLLTGNLTAFGFGVAADPFEFLFEVTSGDADVLYGGIGATGGVIMSSINTEFTGSFEDDWASTAPSDTSDTAPIPEPASMLLLLAGLIGLAGFRRKIKK